MGMANTIKDNLKEMVHSFTNIFRPSDDHNDMRSQSDHLEQNNNPSAVEQNINSSDLELNNNNRFPPEHNDDGNSNNRFPFHVVLAVVMALISAQLENESLTRPSLYVLSLLILVVFLCVLVANLIGGQTPFVNTARVLEKVAVLLASIAVVFTIAIPLPLPLKCFTWFLYLVALFSVLFCCFT